MASSQTSYQLLVNNRSSLMVVNQVLAVPSNQSPASTLLELSSHHASLHQIFQIRLEVIVSSYEYPLMVPQ
jgi:hypothetical protein